MDCFFGFVVSIILALSRDIIRSILSLEISSPGKTEKTRIWNGLQVPLLRGLPRDALRNYRKEEMFTQTHNLVDETLSVQQNFRLLN
jgi:hypothetical protein